ncbi:MAG: biotin--[acetyl-CoA-carboxylase] ligase [Bacillota bacterium]|nr:biotin--[acetyl-CoA-carboxylase] ligase [Clostridia bacterium]
MKEAILKLLKNSPGFLSGEEISSVLGVSRTAIWKHIRTLKKEGYIIESQTKQGYRLLKVPDRLYPEEIKEYLDTSFIGRNIYYYQSVNSTNMVAKDIAEKGFNEGTVVIGEMQTEGKGRLGRKWYSSGTGVCMSIIVKPLIPPSDAPKLTLLTAVSVAQVIQQETGIKPGIKWPNDIFLHGKKLCGILTEMKADMDQIHYVIVGIGINVNDNSFPEDLREATSLKLETGSDVNRLRITGMVLNKWEENYIEFLRHGFGSIRSVWKDYSVNLGRDVTVHTLQGILEGRVMDIDDEGLLLVQDNQGIIHKIVAGDVSLRKEGIGYEN